MDMYLVERPADEVLVSILKHKTKNKYSFINITKQHICPCEFNNIKEALEDMDKLIEEGKIIKYKKLSIGGE